MFEIQSLITRISNSNNRLIARVFGYASFQHQIDPSQAASVIAGIERKIYGPMGLEEYEKTQPDELRRLARRSVAQYLCQRALVHNRWIAFTQSVVCLMGVVPLFLGSLVATTFRSRKKNSGHNDIVVFGHYDEMRDIVLPEASDRQPVYYTRRAVYLGKKELIFLARLAIRYPRTFLYPWLQVNVLRWLSYYAYIVHYYDPKTVVNFFERTASSSVITAYLHTCGIKHVNLMHGERFPSCIHSFCEFDSFHVWSRYFVSLFSSQRCPKDRFVIQANPRHVSFFTNLRRTGQPRALRVLIVHSQLLTADSLYFPSLVDIISRLGPEWRVFFRPHFLDVAQARSFLRSLSLQVLGIQIVEESHTVPLAEALAATRVAVGPYSTALLEAWVAGCKLIHLPGGMNQDVLMQRYGGSPNVLYYTGDAVSLRQFLAAPARLDAEEDLRVDQLTSVLQGTRHSGKFADRRDQSGAPEQ